jgi:uncharacterized protein (TIGR02246 family)
MLSKLSFCCLLLCSMVLAACGGTAQAPQTATTSADTTSINDVRSKYQAAFNSGDAAGMAALFADNAVSLPDHHVALEGRAAIQQDFQDQFAQVTGNMQIMPVDTEINGETAYERGTYTMTITPKATGGAPMKETGKYIVILKKQPNGSWLLQNDINNTNVPPPGMAMPGTGGH